MESRPRRAIGALVRPTAPSAGYNWQWDDVVVGPEASYAQCLFGGASRATKELVSGSALSDAFFHDVARSIGTTDFDMATFRARRLRMGLLPSLHVRKWICPRQCRHRTLRNDP